MPNMTKDPDAVLDYGLDWSSWLVTGDTITASTWELTGPDATLTIDSDFSDEAVTGIWLSGGTAGAKYKATNHIVTAAGREDDRSFDVTVKER